MTTPEEAVSRFPWPSGWLAWFWRRRDHGFRAVSGPGCARCGGYEYGEPRHPRGSWFMGRRIDR